MADEYRPKIGDRVAVVGEVTDVGIRNAWVRFGNDSGSTLMVPLEAVQSDATAELRDLFRRVANMEIAAVRENEALRARVAELEGAAEEREADMHMRIRADYDRTVADSWRAANARVTAERDQALARIAESEGAAAKPAEPAVTIHMQSRAKPLELHGHHVHTCPECHEDLPCEQTCAVEPDLEREDGTSRGLHVVCDACAAVKPAEPVDVDAALDAIREVIDIATLEDDRLVIIGMDQTIYAADCDALAKAFADLARHLREVNP